jgi:hypothetical protein
MDRTGDQSDELPLGIPLEHLRALPLLRSTLVLSSGSAHGQTLFSDRA